MPLPDLHLPTEFDAGLDAGTDALGLLAAAERDTPLFLATPSHWVMSEPGAALQPLQARPDELALRAREALAAAARAGQPQAAIAGALPFDPEQPAQLHLTPRLRRARPVPVKAPSLPAWTQAVKALPSAQRYAESVAEAVSRLKQGALDKVVLARTLVLQGQSVPALPDLLARLLARHPLALTFSARTGPGRCLVGASPELLVRREGGWLRANPLAGSIPRAADPVEDERRGLQLLASAKDLHEHALVVQAVEAALRPHCPSLQVPARPSLVKTPSMWHLSTEIQGPTPTDALTLALALHPTPAVCGHPRAQALSLIRELEPFERGSYAGAVGWMDAQGDGEWVVAIRCAELREDALQLFAGAGIVAASDPLLEQAETGAKFRTMLDALGLGHDITEVAPDLRAVTARQDAGRAA